MSELSDNVAAAFRLCNEQRERIAALEAKLAENAALLKALTDEGAEVVNRVTAKVIAARKGAA